MRLLLEQSGLELFVCPGISCLSNSVAMTVIVQKEMLEIRQICWLNVSIIVIRQEENYRKFIQPQKKKKRPCLVILDCLMLLKALCVLISLQAKSN